MVSAVAFGLEHFLVGGLEQIRGIFVVRLPFGGADAHRDCDPRAFELEARVGDQAVDLSGELCGAIETNLRRDERELLPANSGQDVIDSKPPQEDRAQLSQDGVAGQVTKAVVDVLEEINIEDEQGKGALVSLGARDLPVEHLVEVPLVVKLREAIGRHEPIDLFVVLHFHVVSDDELQNGSANLELVTMAKPPFFVDEVVIDVGPVRRAEIADQELAALEANATVIARDAFLVDLDFALGRASDDQGFSGDAHAAAHLLSVDDDQTSVLAARAGRTSFRDLRQDGLAGARRLILERHPPNIPRPALSR